MLTEEETEDGGGYSDSNSSRPGSMLEQGGGGRSMVAPRNKPKMMRIWVSEVALPPLFNVFLGIFIDIIHYAPSNILYLLEFLVLFGC